MTCLWEDRQGFCDGCDECGGPTLRRCCIPDCDGAVARTSELPVCHACGVKIALAHQFEASRLNAVAAEVARRRAIFEAEREAKRQLASLVYYVDFGPHIKIGYTSRLRERLSGLRVYPHQLLAIEPGGRSVEKARHRQFDALRFNAREDFHPGDELLAHIEAMRAEHDLPNWAKVPDTRVKIRGSK